MSGAGFTFGLRSSESVLASPRLSASPHLSPPDFVLPSATRPTVQQSGQFGFSRSISVTPLLFQSDLLVVSNISARKSLNQNVSSEAHESTVLLESHRLGHSDLASRSSHFGSIIRADSALVNFISQMKSSSSYPPGSLSFVASDVLKATLTFWSTRSDRAPAESSHRPVSRSLVTSASHGAAATVTFIPPGWNSIWDSVTTFSALGAPVGAQSSQLGPTLGLIFGVLAAILLLLAGFIIWFLRRRWRTTYETVLESSVGSLFSGDLSLTGDETLGFYEHPESSSVDQSVDFGDQASELELGHD